MKNKYLKLSQEIESLGGTVLRGLEKSSEDLDVYVPKKKVEFITGFLEKNLFVKIGSGKGYIHYKKIEGDNCYFVDLNLDLNYFFYLFPDVSLKKDFIEDYLKNPFSHENLVAMNFLRYIFTFRKEEKYFDFIMNNKKLIEKRDFFLSFLNNNPFKKKLRLDKLKLLLNMNPPTLINYFGLKRSVNLYKNVIKRKYKNGSGEIIVFLGIDGAGKTTVIEKLSKCLHFKKIYLGSVNYSTHNRLKKLEKRHESNLLLKVLTKTVTYIENLSRISKAIFYKKIGKKVLLDRHPYYDLFSINERPFLKINKILYGLFFPKKIDKILILYESPEIILKRKSERSFEEIKLFYKNIFRNLKGDNIFKIKNDNLNRTLYKISKLILYKDG